LNDNNGVGYSFYPMITAEINKLRWRCRRGTLELDVIFQRFLDQHFEQLTVVQQQTFIQMLTLEDDQLIRYFIEEQLPEDPLLKELVIKMRDWSRR
jgi:antitoxin CptB